MPHLLALWAVRASAAFAWWASIVFAAMPFVIAGAMCGPLLARWTSRQVAAAMLFCVAPGCDCANSGYAGALVAVPPALAGFVLQWSAVANPVALAATYATLGPHVLFARIAGAGVAALGTAACWHATRSTGPPGAPALHATARDRIAAALSAVSVSAAVATLLLCDGTWHSTIATSSAWAALAGAALSPCSTTDATVARMLVRAPSAQAAFVVAAQCLDARQLLTLWRHFGAGRALLGAGSAVTACVVAAALAR